MTANFTLELTNEEEESLRAYFATPDSTLELLALGVASHTPDPEGEIDARRVEGVLKGLPTPCVRVLAAVYGSPSRLKLTRRAAPDIWAAWRAASTLYAIGARAA